MRGLKKAEKAEVKDMCDQLLTFQVRRDALARTWVEGETAQTLMNKKKTWAWFRRARVRAAIENLAM